MFHGCFILFHFCILCRCHAKVFLENSRKVGLIVESNRVCHLGNIYLLIAYQACCLFQSDIADKLTELKSQVWNEALTYLGISNVNIQKKERLITDEVARTQGGTIASRYSRLESRRQAAEKINDMFGLDITVDFREDFQQNTPDESFDEGGRRG